MLVLLTGLPGTGKSAIADAVAGTLDAPVFAVDPLEAVLLRLGITREQGSDVAAYEIAYALARSQLEAGRHVVVDAVNGYPPWQDRWRAVALEFGEPALVIATTCSDRALHKRRLETRNRQIEGFVYDARWEDLEGSYQEWYVPFPDPALVLDAVAPLDENIQTAVAYVESLIRLR